MIINPYIESILNFNLFSHFTKDELNQLFIPSKYEIKEYRKGQIIHLQNESCHTLDVILYGQVSVSYIDESGNILTINVFSSGDMISASLLFSTRNQYPMTVTATAAVRIIHINKDLIQRLCQSNIHFMNLLMQEISNKSLILTDKIHTISLSTIKKSIINFLIYEYQLQKCKVIKLNISKKDWAEKLGIQRSSLSRELNKMRIDGLIEFDTKTITIKNMDIIRN